MVTVQPAYGSIGPAPKGLPRTPRFFSLALSAALAVGLVCAAAFASRGFGGSAVELTAAPMVMVPVRQPGTGTIVYVMEPATQQQQALAIQQQGSAQAVRAQQQNLAAKAASKYSSLPVAIAVPVAPRAAMQQAAGSQRMVRS